MASAHPTYQGNLIKHAHGFCRQRLVLRIFTLLHFHAFSRKRTVEYVTQSFFLRLGQFHLIPKSEISLQSLLYLFPSHTIPGLPAQTVQNRSESGFAHPLVLQSLQVKRIFARTQYQTSRLMVGTDNDKGFIGMLFIELKCLTDSLVQIHYLTESSSGIVAMARPVDFPSFYHQEKSLAQVFRKETDSRTGNVAQGKVPFFAIDGKRNGITMCLRLLFGLEQNQLVCLIALRHEIIVSTRKGITILLSQRIKAFRFPLVIRVKEIRTGIKIKTGEEQIFSYLIIVFPAGVMGIKSGRSGMVYAYTCSDPHTESLFFCPHRNACNRCLLVFLHTDNPIHGFLARRESRTSGGRVGHSIRRRISRTCSCIRKLCKIKRSNRYFTIQLTQIKLGSLYLIDSHTVTDKEEYIFCLLGMNKRSKQKTKQEE